MDIYEKMTIHLRMARYREKTVHTYVRNIRMAVAAIGKEPGDLGEDDILQFLNGLFERGASGPTIISYFSSLKYMISKVLQQTWPVARIERFGKFGANRPRPLSRDEIKSLLDAAPNLKYKTLFALAYSSGMRISEICKLQITDLDFNLGLIHVRDGKGGIDRHTTLSKRAARMIQAYMAQTSIKSILFPCGRKICGSGELFPVAQTDKAVSIRSVQFTFENLTRRLKFSGHTTFHSLRHSFGTHLVEDGMSIFTIQKLMGHRNIRTTLRYLYTAESPRHTFFSPLDNL